MELRIFPKALALFVHLRANRPVEASICGPSPAAVGSGQGGIRVAGDPHASTGGARAVPHRHPPERFVGGAGEAVCYFRVTCMFCLHRIACMFVMGLV